MNSEPSNNCCPTTNRLEMFHIAVLSHPRKTSDGGLEPVETKIIVQPEWVLAANRKAAETIAIRKIPAEHSEAEVSRMEILVRPF